MATHAPYSQRHLHPQIPTINGLRVCKTGSSETGTLTPYRGPYCIVQSSDKAYLLNIHRKQDWVTLDRLKPAYVEPMDYVTHTRAGRKSRPPDRLGL